MFAATDRPQATHHETGPTDDQWIRSGDLVEVQNRLTGTWSTGFEVAEVVADAPDRHYVIRRCSDGDVLPAIFDGEVVRPCP